MIDPTADLLHRALATMPPPEKMLVQVKTIPGQTAQYGENPEGLHPMLRQQLASHGIQQIYLHQTQAIEAALRGKDVCITTGTNSGKSLCYTLPLLQSCLEEPIAKGLLIFPTKALAQDQAGKLTNWTQDLNLSVGVFDGDTPAKKKALIRTQANLVLSNPDMLHVGILPNFENWTSLFRSLRCIVLDEIHVYRGAFGSHVAWILRRLLRHCETFGSAPQIIGCSATIGNAKEHFELLTGRNPVLVQEDWSPRSKRHFLFANPQPDETGEEPSRNYITAMMMRDWAAQDIKSIAFCRSRVGVELVAKYAQENAEAAGLSASAFESYRAGYTVEERRSVEASFADSGKLGLIATSAMELGVDIGTLDGAILNGYPGSQASFWQQAGRAGRGSKPGVVAFLAGEDPLDQFLVSHPQELLLGSNEIVRIDPENATIAEDQLRCMAFERAISPSEALSYGNTALQIAEAMDAAGTLDFQNERFYYPSQTSPAPGINIRSTGGPTFTLFLSGVELGSMEEWRAHQQAHTGAIYLHRAASFRSTELNLHERRAEFEPYSGDLYTQAVVNHLVEPQLTFRQSRVGALETALQSQRITSQVVGFRERAVNGGRTVGDYPLELPALSFDTIGIRLDLPEVPEEFDSIELITAIHGLEHALIAVAPWLAGCDRGDLGSIWYPDTPESSNPSIFLFDRNPGGIGLAVTLFDRIESLLLSAGRMLSECRCDTACPRCLLSARCEASNQLLDRKLTIRYLARVAT